MHPIEVNQPHRLISVLLRVRYCIPQRRNPQHSSPVRNNLRSLRPRPTVKNFHIPQRIRLLNPRTMRIDAICINQLDVKERGSQVGCMRGIYRQSVMSPADTVSLFGQYLRL